MPVDRKGERDSIPKLAVVGCATTVSLWVICLSLMGYWRHVLRLPYPYNFPFFPVNHFYDLWCFNLRFQHLHSRAFFSPDLGLPFQYPGSAALIYAALTLSGHPYWYFPAVTLSLILLLGFVLGKHMIASGLTRNDTVALLLASFIFSYPFWYEYVQSNIEVVIFAVIAGGIFAFLSGKTYLAAALFGFAASAKIFPFVFFALLVSRRRWREVGVGLAIGAAAEVAGLWMLCPDIAYAHRGVSAGLTANRADIVLYFDRLAIGFDHSLFGMMKRLLFHSYGSHYPLFLLYSYLAGVALLGITLWIVRIRKLPLLNQIVCLTICAILLPPTSYEYTLMHMYVPWGLLVLYIANHRTKGGAVARGLMSMFVCFGVLFGPCTELIVHGVNAGGQLKCLVLVTMLIVALRYPWYGIEDLWSLKPNRPSGHTERFEV